MTFEPLYYADRLQVVNPGGDVGLLTLWSPTDTVRRLLGATSASVLDEQRSRIAVIANLYGDGMYAMFCNLLFNPQIRYLVALGEELGQPTCAEITAFLEHGLEDASLLGRRLKRVIGTQRYFPALADFDETRLRDNLAFYQLGSLSRERAAEKLPELINSLPAPRHPRAERIRVDIPAFSESATYLPSDVMAHQVVRRHPLDCWEELVVRCVRFGRPVVLRDGPRLELLNAKVVIAEPKEEPREILAAYGFDLDGFLEYQDRMLQPRLPAHVAYTYGNRIGGYFQRGGTKLDSLQSVIDGFVRNPETRRNYLSLWDTPADLAASSSADDSAAVPCLTTMFFRKSEDQLTLTATFRSHNLLTAWLENVYGLMAIQRHVAAGTGMAPGPIAVISHSLGIDPRSDRYPLAQAIADGWKGDEDLDRVAGKRSMHADPNGYFVLSVDHDARCIIADHMFAGVLIRRYKSRNAARIERAIVADMAVSQVSHALWLGRELAAKEQLLRLRPRDASARGTATSGG